MTNMIQKPYTMNVKDFENCLKTLNCLLYLMPHNHEEDSSFSESDLKTLLLKSILISWEHAYALKGTCTSDDYCHMCCLTL
jgi:hypothetical protein